MLCLVDLASPRVNVRARIALRSRELDDIGPDETGRKDERGVRYPLAVLENKFAALARSCFGDRNGFPDPDCAVAVVEELVESEEALILEVVLARDGDARHGDHVNVERAGGDEDEVVLRRIELLGESAGSEGACAAAADDHDVLLRAFVGHSDV